MVFSLKDSPSGCFLTPFLIDGCFLKIAVLVLVFTRDFICYSLVIHICRLTVTQLGSVALVEYGQERPFR